MERARIPGTTTTIEVPAGRQAVCLETSLLLPLEDEDTALVGTEAYSPTRRGVYGFCLSRTSGTPREAAMAWCAKLQGHPDILDSELMPGAVVFEWTDGVRCFRSWYITFAGRLLEFDFWVWELEDLQENALEIEAGAASLLKSLRDTTAQPRRPDAQHTGSGRP